MNGLKSESQATLNSTWDDRPREYDRLRNCWLNERRRRYVLSQGLSEATGSSVLEIGSGTGWLLRGLAKAAPQHSYFGLEPQESYVDFANQEAQSQGLHNLNFCLGAAENLANSAFAGKAFEYVFSNDVLHHVVDQSVVCHQVSAHSPVGARWLAIEPNCYNPYTFIRQATGQGEKNFRPRQFLLRAEKAGWRLIRKEFLFVIPPFVREPGSFLQTVERVIEGNAWISGGVALHLVRVR